MLDIPFELEPLPAAHADAALKRLSRERVNSVPVLLGDADVFSTEWAEQVDRFENPAAVVRQARDINLEDWFKTHGHGAAASGRLSGARQLVKRLIWVPVDLFLLPLWLLHWLATAERPVFFGWSLPSRTRASAAPGPITVLRRQLTELRRVGTATEAELAEFEAAISALEQDGAEAIFPDPVAYVTPRRGATVAAGIVEVSEPWEAIAWLQHGTYAARAPRPLLVAHCKWLWQAFGAQVITASTDHIGFQMDRPIATPAKARLVLDRFMALGATEVNAELDGGDGASLVGAERLWVWWD